MNNAQNRQANVNLANQQYAQGAIKIDQEKLKDYVNNSVLTVDLQDQQLVDLLLEVPKVSMIIGFMALAFNVLLPGFGTIIAACAVEDMVSKTHVLCGVLQFFTSFILVGWAWAIYWGWLIFQKAQQGAASSPNQNYRQVRSPNSQNFGGRQQ